MSDLRSVLDRELRRVDVPPLSLETFYRRREQKRRRDRVLAAALALTIALVSAGFFLRAFDRGGGRPATAIDVRPGSIAFVGVKGSGPGTGVFVYDPATRRTSTLVDLGCSVDTSGTRSCPGLQIRGIAWSPDGTRLAYSLIVSRGGNGAVWTGSEADAGMHVLDLRTGATTLIAPCPRATCGEIDDPAWSPDTSQIAYARSGAIWIMNADGTGARSVATTPGSGSPSWSPDGQSLVFAAESTFDGSGVVLFSVPIEGGAPAPLILPVAGGISIAGTEPELSPDGSAVAFVEPASTGPMAGPDGRLVVADLVRGTSTTIRVGPRRLAEVGPPTWSPDGTEIATTVDGVLYTVRPNGTGATELAHAWTMPAYYP